MVNAERESAPIAVVGPMGHIFTAEANWAPVEPILPDVLPNAKTSSKLALAIALAGCAAPIPSESPVVKPSTPAPTASASPSENPTASPTNAPTPSPTEAPTPSPTPIDNVDAAGMLNEVMIDDIEAKTGEIDLISFDQLKEDFTAFWNAKASEDSLTNGQILGRYQFADCGLLNEACFGEILDGMKKGERESRIEKTAEAITLLIAAANEADDPLLVHGTVIFSQTLYKCALWQIEPKIITTESFTSTRHDLNAAIIRSAQSLNITL